MTSLTDLNASLFAQLDRLSRENLTDDEIQREVKRAGAIVAVADQITGSAQLQLQAAKLFALHGAAVVPHLPRIGKAVGKDE